MTYIVLKELLNTDWSSG